MKKLIAVQLDDADIRALNDAFRVISNMREVLKVPDVTLDKIRVCEKFSVISDLL